jgi:hypothetical protein
MEKTVASLAVLALVVFFGSGVERSPSGTNTVHADEALKWTKVETPLSVYHHESRAPNSGYAGAEGFWQSTSSSKDKQLAFPMAVSINCTQNNMACTESQATVVLGLLKADLVEYEISSWTKDGVVADNEGSCGIGHRLSLDFKSNTVTVTDYPKRVLGGDCQPFQDANSYILHGGGLMLSPPATWDPLAKPTGQK